MNVFKLLKKSFRVHEVGFKIPAKFLQITYVLIRKRNKLPNVDCFQFVCTHVSGLTLA